MIEQVILKKDVEKKLIDIREIILSSIKGVRKYQLCNNKEDNEENKKYKFIIRIDRFDYSFIKIEYIEFIKDGSHYYKLVDKDYAGISYVCRDYNAFLKFIEKCYITLK